MKAMSAKGPIENDNRPYLSIVGATIPGIGIYSLIPKSQAGLWIEMPNMNDTWIEKLPSGSSVIYVNEDK